MLFQSFQAMRFKWVVPRPKGAGWCLGWCLAPSVLHEQGAHVAHSVVPRPKGALCLGQQGLAQKAYSFSTLYLRSSALRGLTALSCGRYTLFTP